MLIKMEDILIWNGTIWTLDDPEIICNGWLTAAGGVITAVGQGEPPVYLQAETVIDAKGHILMPGLVDCHTHLMEYATAEIHHTQGQAQEMAAISNLLTALQAGIVATGEHHLGHLVLSMPMAQYKKIRDMLPMASAIAYGCCWLGFEPKVLTSATWPGRSETRDTLTDRDYELMAEASEFPGENIFMNYTCANVPLAAAPNAGTVTYEESQLRHIIELFHKKGKKIGTHIEGDEAARRFLACGGDVIHHGHGISPETGAIMAKQKTPLVLTPAAGTSKRPTSPEEALAFYRQGIFLALASDSYIYPHPQADWISLPKDRLSGPADFLKVSGPVLRYFVENGVKKSDALRLITVNPRQLLHPEEGCAVLKPGCPADMILCSRLPAIETESLEDILLVITRGQIQVDRQI